MPSVATSYAYHSPKPKSSGRARIIVTAQQVVEFVLHHGCDEPSLEAGTASLFSRRMLDIAGKRDEARRILARLPLQRARKLVGVVPQTNIEKDDARRILLRKDERACSAVDRTDSRISLSLIHISEPTRL